MEGRGCGGYYGRGSGGPGGGRGSGRNGDRNGGRGRNGGGGYQQHCQTQYNESGGRGRGPGGGRGRGRNSGRGRNGGGGYQQHYQTQYNESGGRGRGRGYDNRAPQQQSSGGSAMGSVVWTGMQWGSSSASSSTGQTQRLPRSPPSAGGDGAVFCIFNKVKVCIFNKVNWDVSCIIVFFCCFILAEFGAEFLGSLIKAVNNLTLQ